MCATGPTCGECGHTPLPVAFLNSITHLSIVATLERGKKEREGEGGRLKDGGLEGRERKDKTKYK